jgi:hypothetical protein
VLLTFNLQNVTAIKESEKKLIFYKEFIKINMDLNYKIAIKGLNEHLTYPFTGCLVRMLQKLLCIACAKLYIRHFDI